MSDNIFPQLEIPNTLAAGPGPGNTDPRVLQRFAGSGVADHMQADVLRGMSECKFMLREVFGTSNVHTFGVAGTGWSGLDAMMSAVQPGDSVVAFVNGTFSIIDGLTLRAHWETGSGRVNDIRGFSDACERHGAMGLVDAVSSLGVADFSIDDYPGIVAWASCPQKGICCLPLTYAPVSFNDTYIDALKSCGARTFVHHPILEARHWGIVNGEDVDKGTYHRTHSGYAVAAFHEALRLTLTETVASRAASYEYHEAALKGALQFMGCEVTSNMTSLVVFNLPQALAGREMELVQTCRERGFGIWPTLSQPVQVRIGILNQLSQHAVSDIVTRFALVMNEAGANVDINELKQHLHSHYEQALIAA